MLQIVPSVWRDGQLPRIDCGTPQDTLQRRILVHLDAEDAERLLLSSIFHMYRNLRAGYRQE